MSDDINKLKTNFEMLLDTVNALKYSQGFYSRLANELEKMDSYELECNERYINSLPQFKDSLDVVMFLEG